jgi:hypothetical protein
VRRLVAISVTMLFVLVGINLSANNSFAADEPKASGATLAAAGLAACSINVLGSVNCWGGVSNIGDVGETDIPWNIGNVTQIAAGDRHMCALTSKGEVSCWGANWSGQLFPPSDLGTVVQLAAGANHTCALSSAGKVVCWGGADEISVPTNLSRAIQISSRGYHSCAVTEAGSVICWGDNPFGKTTVPSDLGRVLQVSVGYEHVCAITELSRVKCWGDNSRGQSTVPSDLENVMQVAAGWHHTCALKRNGSSVCWGWNYYGQLNADAPVGRLIMQIAVGNAFTCLVYDQGVTECKGYSGTQATNIPLNMPRTMPGGFHPPFISNTPALNGVPAVGNVLSCGLFGWDSGVSVSYQWLRDGIEVPGATSGVFTLSELDYGTNVSVQVDGVKTGFQTVSRTSPETLVGLGTIRVSSKPLVIGDAKVGKTLYARTGTWEPSVTFEYQWFRDGIAIPKATSHQYKTVAADFRRKVSIKVVGLKPGYKKHENASSAITIGLGSMSKAPIPKISGLAKVNQTLTSSTGAWESGVELSYQWMRNGAAISKATLAKYKLRAADKGKKMSVKVTGKKLGYQTVSKTSAPLSVK